MNYSNDTQSIFMRDFQLDLTVSFIFYGIQWFLFLPTVYVNSLVFRMAIRESLSISLELKVVFMIYIIVLHDDYQKINKFVYPIQLKVLFTQDQTKHFVRTYAIKTSKALHFAFHTFP